MELRVVKHVFLPSGRELWTVVGRDEYLILAQELACSCKDSIFKVLRGELFKPCKHVREYLRRLYTNDYDVVKGLDEELVTLIKVISDDIKTQLLGEGPR